MEAEADAAGQPLREETMKHHAEALGDRLALWLFIRLLKYWQWRTGRPAVVTMMHPDLAQAQFRGEAVH